jgi:hypothetical protein
LVRLSGVWLYRVFKFDLEDALEVVKSGEPELIYQAQGLGIDLESQ